MFPGELNQYMYIQISFHETKSWWIVTS